MSDEMMNDNDRTKIETARDKLWQASEILERKYGEDRLDANIYIRLLNISRGLEAAISPKAILPKLLDDYRGCLQGEGELNRYQLGELNRLYESIRQHTLDAALALLSEQKAHLKFLTNANNNDADPAAAALVLVNEAETALKAARGRLNELS